MGSAADIFTTLKGLVSNRCYPLTAPDNTKGDYITYQQISGVPENGLEGPVLTNYRYQVDAYSATYAGAKALVVAIKTAMAASAISEGQAPLILSERDLPFESQPQLYRVSMDFSIWGE